MTRFCVTAGAMLLALAPALALDGQPALHDPSTLIEAGGQVRDTSFQFPSQRASLPV